MASRSSLQHLVAPVVASEAARWGRVEFETELPLDLPAVFGERTYVEQVLRNLISNAGKYGTPGTTVDGRGRGDRRRGPRPGRSTAAPGVSADEADRLFDLFYRSPQATRTASGAGIGLYVSRGLITAMGGRIWARPAMAAGPSSGSACPTTRTTSSRSRAGRPAGARADRPPPVAGRRADPGVRSTRPGGWGRLVESNSRVSITIATAEGRDARIAS